MVDVNMADGSTSFISGVNSIKPTTVASAINPQGLPRDQLSWLINATVRGGGITCRNGWKYCCTVNPGTSLYQGGSMYEPDGLDPYLVLAIGGKLHRIRVDTNNSVDEISTGTTLNPENEDQYHFLQAERFLIIQVGDNVTLPLFWDGDTMRRSNGLVNAAVYSGRILTGDWQVPATGATVAVTFDAPYAGGLGDVIIIPSEINLSGTTIVDWSGVNQRYQVTAIAGANVTLKLIEAVLPGSFNVANLPTIRNPVAELPAATAMDYYMGRIWYARGRTYTAGDIVKGPSGTAPYNFFDSILKVTENPLAIGGDGFTVPAQAGNIRALAHTAELNTALGQGQLYVFTRRAIYRLTVPVSRTAWIDASDSTQPLQTVAQLRYGSVGDRCVVQVNEDLFYQTMEPAIRSLVLSIRNGKQWGNPSISSNEDRLLKFNDRERLRFASGILFDNRLWQTALPKETPVGTAFQAVAPLDFTLISTLEEQLPPAWEGMYEGLDILQLFEADFGGRQRAFAAVVSRVDGSIQVWEMTDHLKTDFNPTNESRITWISEYPAYTWRQEYLLKKLTGGELWVDRVYGEVVFKVEYRPDGDACWHHWHTWKICSARNSCEDVDNPICYPLLPYAEGFRQNMDLPKPQQGCQSTSGRPLNVGYQFQVKITVTGWCRIRGLLLYSEQVERRQYQKIICSGEEEIMPDTDTTDPGPSPDVHVSTFGEIDPFLGPPHPPTGYQLFINETGQPRLTWTAPEVFIDAAMVIRYTPLILFEFTITNYEWPAWSAVTNYQNNQRAEFGGVRYVSVYGTLESPNTNNQPGSSPGFWAVDPTEFELWKFNGSAYVKIGDSLGFGSPTIYWDWATLLFRAQLPNQGLDPWSFYIVANAGTGSTAQSSTFGFSDSCVPPSPLNFAFEQTGPQGGRFTWLEGGTGAQLDYIIACGQTDGGPYDVFDTSVDPEAAFQNVDGLSGGTYYAIMCRRDSPTCISEASNQVMFQLP